MKKSKNGRGERLAREKEEGLKWKEKGEGIGTGNVVLVSVLPFYWLRLLWLPSYKPVNVIL